MQAQTAGSQPVISGIADSPNQTTAPAASGIADAPVQPGVVVAGIADAPVQPAVAVSGIADAPGRLVAPASGIADGTNQPAATSGIADSPNQPVAPTSGIADAPNQPVAPANSGIAGIAEPGGLLQPSASGIAAPGVPEPEQYQGPARAPAAPKTPAGVAPKVPVRVQGPAYGRGGGYTAARPGYRYAAVPRVAARGPIAQAPRLPNTGTGGLLQTATPDGVTPWLPAFLLLAALALGGSAALAVRRAR